MIPLIDCRESRERTVRESRVCLLTENHWKTISVSWYPYFFIAILSELVLTLLALVISGNFNYRINKKWGSFKRKEQESGKMSSINPKFSTSPDSS